MKQPFFAATLLLGLSAGLAFAAPAAPTEGTPSESAALKAYEANTNPSVSVPTTGPYDARDRYTAPNGYQLPGYGLLPPS